MIFVISRAGKSIDVKDGLARPSLSKDSKPCLKIAFQYLDLCNRVRFGIPNDRQTFGHKQKGKLGLDC